MDRRIDRIDEQSEMNAAATPATASRTTAVRIETLRPSGCGSWPASAVRRMSWRR